MSLSSVRCSSVNMIKCFACKKKVGDIETLFSHIKKHKIIKKKGIFQCTVPTCWQTFDNWANFKKHVKRCYEKGQIDGDITQDPEPYICSYDENLFDFEEAINGDMVKFACGLAANMKMPRNEVFKTTSLVQNTFWPTLISGKYFGFVLYSVPINITYK